MWVYITWDTLQYVHTSGTYMVTFDMTGQMKSHNFGVNLAYVPHVCTYYFSFFRAIGTYPNVFGAHKNFWSDVWYKRYRISNVSTPRNFCVRNFGRFSLEKLNIFGPKFRPTWNISQIQIQELKINFGYVAHIKDLFVHIYETIHDVHTSGTKIFEK